MCSSPTKIGPGTWVACRVCNECVALRIDDWAWRCAAETESYPFGVSIGLTYDGSAKSADGARGFRYLDVRRFLAALRDAAARAAEEQGVQRPVVRFLVAGELGSQKKRVHWHMLLWSDFPLTDLGDWGVFKEHARLGRMPSEGVVEGLKVRHRHEERLIWSLWPFGHVYTKALTFDSARYALKYVAKNQFSNDQSRGTARDGSGDNVAASYFRMSKRPPIGARFLAAWLDRNLERRQIPPGFNVKVGDNPGYWHLKGEMRKWALSALALEMADGDSPAGSQAFLQRAKRTEWGRNDLRFIKEIIRGEKEKRGREN